MQKPTKGNLLQRGHPLARGIILCSLMNTGIGDRIIDLSGNAKHGIFQSPSPLWSSNSKGLVVEHTAVDQKVDFGDSNLILPAQEISIVLGYRKADGVNRISGAVGLTSAASVTERCGVHLPYSDGVVYWDFGGGTEDLTRESVSGLTFGDDNWVFTSGPKGMEIWQNGILMSSNSANPTRDSTSTPFQLGTHGGADSDLAEYRYLYIYDRQLSTPEIMELNIDSYQMFNVNLAPEIFAPIAVAVGNPWYAYAQQ